MEKRQNERKVRKTIRIAAVVIIAAGALCLFLRSITDLLADDGRSAHGGTSPTFNIHEYPDRLVYVMGKDTELDLTGGKICFSGSGKKTNGLSCRYADGGNNCGKIYDMADISWYTSDVNFSEPGTYFIRFAQENIGSCAFLIEVADPEKLQ